MKKYLIYAWSDSTMIVGKNSDREINGAYVIIDDCIIAKNEFNALEQASKQYNMHFADLMAVEIK